MLTLEDCRKIDPSLRDLTDEQLRQIRASLYDLGQLAFQSWVSKKYGSKIPVGLLPKKGMKGRI
jgi:hypothetical protein